MKKFKWNNLNIEINNNELNYYDINKKTIYIGEKNIFDTKSILHELIHHITIIVMEEKNSNIDIFKGTYELALLMLKPYKELKEKDPIGYVYEWTALLATSPNMLNSLIIIATELQMKCHEVLNEK